MQCPKTYYTPEEVQNIVRSLLIYDPYGSRTRIVAVKGRCPKPLDEGAVPYSSLDIGVCQLKLSYFYFISLHISEFVHKPESPVTFSTI